MQNVVFITNYFYTNNFQYVFFNFRTDFEAGTIDRPEFLLRVKNSMKTIEQVPKISKKQLNTKM